MPEPRWWPSFCEAVGRPQWVTDERFATISARKQHMSELTDEMDQLFAERTLPEWGRLLDEKLTVGFSIEICWEDT